MNYAFLVPIASRDKKRLIFFYHYIFMQLSFSLDVMEFKILIMCVRVLKREKNFARVDHDFIIFNIKCMCKASFLFKHRRNLQFFLTS